MRKKSIRKSAADFRNRADAAVTFLTTVATAQSDEHKSWLYEYAIIRLYRDFEALILDALVGAINNDTSTISQSAGVPFPKHLTDEVCAFLVIGDGFFDFKGRDGLIGTLKRFVPDNHYLVDVAKNQKYKATLEQLSSLRNLAAHDSIVARGRAKRVLGQKKMGSAGSWLKRQGRFSAIASRLQEFASELEGRAPY